MPPSEKRPAFLLTYCLASLLACLPIILFIPRYIDDYRRGTRGYFDWTEAGFRPLADWLYSAFNLGSPAIAVAPLAQLCSIPVSAIGALAISRTFQISNHCLAAAASLPIFINPYFLENLSYGFDSLSMTTALTLALVAAALVSDQNPWRGWGSATCCLLACLLLYQPAVGSFLPLALIAWLWRGSTTSHSTTRKSCGLPALMAIVGAPAASLIAYGVCMKLFWVHRTEYGQSYSRLKPPSDMLNGIAIGLTTYLNSLWKDWHNTALMPIFALLVIGFVIALTARLSQRMTRTKSFVIAAIMPALLLCIAPGPMYLLEFTDFIETPRMNPYIGALVGSLALPVASWASDLSRKSLLRPAGIAILSAWLWCQLVFSYAYGHAMQAQREFEQSRLTRLIDDISHLDINRQAKIIQFEGAMPPSPLLANTTRKFPLMDKLVRRMINGPWFWGSQQLNWLGLDVEAANQNQASPMDVRRAQACRNDQTSRCSSEHNILLAGERVIVMMK
ncbi:MAG: glucosyltransferase domain-containing protein [Cyanobium sp.]